ncbi:unnamed protein product [Heterobilharzia americana]|nr:unnamed protein product [Heterobilharzia americana]
MTKIKFPPLIWEQLVSFLPTSHLYEVRSILGEDIVDQTVELKCEVISFLEIVKDSALATKSFQVTAPHPSACPEYAADIRRFATLYLGDTNKKLKQEIKNQVTYHLKDESELENSIKRIRDGLSKEVSYLEKYLQDMQNSLLKLFDTSNYRDERENRPCQVYSALPVPSTICNTTDAQKQVHELSCGLEFLLSQNSVDKVLPKSVSPYSPTCYAPPSAGASSSSSNTTMNNPTTDPLVSHQNSSYHTKPQRIPWKKSKDGSNPNAEIYSSTNVHKLPGSEGNRGEGSISLECLENGTNEKSNGSVTLSTILNSATNKSYGQLKQSQDSFYINQSQLNNRTLLTSSSEKSYTRFAGNKNCHSCCHFNSAQRFRQMILKARQESADS